MSMTPNFLKIQDTARSCLDGVLTSKEAHAIIISLLEPQNHIPQDELLSQSVEGQREIRLANHLHRIEQKLDAICAFLPEKPADFPDQNLLCDEARPLALAGKKIQAIQIH